MIVYRKGRLYLSADLANLKIVLKSELIVKRVSNAWNECDMKLFYPASQCITFIGGSPF